MSHPRIEEVEDSEDAFSDPSEDDIDDFAESDILRPRAAVTTTTTTRSAAEPAAAQRPPPPLNASPPPSYVSYAALYPVYFDRDRSRAQGRRVSKTLAVANPLARDVVAACAALQLHTVFEPTRTHPKDWANPGRVRVDLGRRASPASPAAAAIHGKHHLYILVARYLAAHPTTENSAGLRETVRGAPPPPPRDQPYPRPAIPRGWKMPELVPYLSPAMTGGGVSENLFQDVMKEMQGGPGGAAGGGLAGAGPGGMDMRQAMAALGAMGGAGGGAGAGAGGSGTAEKKGKKTKGKGKA